VQVKVVLRSDVEVGTYDKVAVICGNYASRQFLSVLISFGTLVISFSSKMSKKFNGNTSVICGLNMIN
jgi:hypothetical protein